MVLIFVICREYPSVVPRLRVIDEVFLFPVGTTCTAYLKVTPLGMHVGNYHS